MRLSLAAVLIGGVVSGPVAAVDGSALDKLNGSWSGTGQATFEGGKSERLSCRAYYRGDNGNRSRSFSIRCASASGKVELRAALSVAGSNVTGQWEERQHNARGALSGKVSSESVHLNFTGGVMGGISLNLAGRNRHSVSLKTTGSSLQSVRIGLNRG